ncbi:putative F-box protein At3g20705 [Cicer arietinum]|uniref:F-box/kelch-repeat protein At3g06240-like n=1 Tax=Cicer arietinum TaxID=3827 RepID=A0A1S2YIR0_CICAR|nr:F-box/kelch-repeat protein At3g06240-like [Cicer arietinum]
MTNEELKARNKLNHIHDDLAFSILSKLPLKSMKRFECIKKSWSILFENHNFMKMFRNNFLSNNNDSDSSNTFLLLNDVDPPAPPEQYRDCSFYLFSSESERFDNRIKLDLPFSIDNFGYGIFILGFNSINGIFCVSREGPLRLRIVLWNPTTAEFFVIPPSPEECVPPYRSPFMELIGFGYDHIRDDYKVIRYIKFLPTTDEEVDVPLKDRSFDPVLEIYSFSSNSWRILDIDMPYTYIDEFCNGTGVHINGMCHWWCRRYSSLEEYLVSFDLINEALIATPASLDMYEGCKLGQMARHLVVLNESISLISNCPETSTFHISTLGELGVEKSWITLFVVGPLPFIECPIGVGKKGNICFKTYDDEIVWVDLNTQIIDEIGVKGTRAECRTGIYKKNLFPIGGINN